MAVPDPEAMTRELAILSVSCLVVIACSAPPRVDADRARPTDPTLAEVTEATDLGPDHAGICS